MTIEIPSVVNEQDSISHIILLRHNVEHTRHPIHFKPHANVRYAFFFCLISATITQPDISGYFATSHNLTE